MSLSNEDKELVAVVKSYLKQHKTLAVKLKELNVYTLQMWVCKCCRDAFVKTRKISGIIIVSRCGHSFIGYQGDLHDINVDKLSSLEGEQIAWEPDFDDEVEDEVNLEELDIDKEPFEDDVLWEEDENEDISPIKNQIELRTGEVDEDAPTETANPIEVKYSDKSDVSKSQEKLPKFEQNPSTSILTKGSVEVPSDCIGLQRPVTGKTKPIKIKVNVPVDWRNPEAILAFLECFTSSVPENALGLEDYVDECMTGFLPEEIKRLEYKVQKWRSYGTKRRKIKDCCYWHAWEENGEMCSRKLRCTFCEYTCQDKDEMKRHRRSLHSTYTPFRCKSCPFESFSFECLANHIRIAKEFSK